MLPRGRYRGKGGRLTAVPFAKIVRVLRHAIVTGVAALMLAGVVTPASAVDELEQVFPAPMTQNVLAKRQQFFQSTQTQLTPALLAAYVERSSRSRVLTALTCSRPAPN